jgi:hypothetical protein
MYRLGSIILCYAILSLFIGAYLRTSAFNFITSAKAGFNPLFIGAYLRTA